jgi:hypothetical protein
MAENEPEGPGLSRFGEDCGEAFVSGLSERLLDYANRFEDNAGVPSDALEADIREAASLIDHQTKALEAADAWVDAVHQRRP